METADLFKLVKWYHRLDAEIKLAEAQLKDQLAEPKANRLKILAKLGTVIHKEEGGLKSIKVPGVGTAYARTEDKYKVIDFSQVKAGVLADLDLTQEQEQALTARMDIFTKAVTKEVIIAHREETGAVEEDGRLIGGDLPEGVGLYTHKEVRIIKGK